VPKKKWFVLQEATIEAMKHIKRNTFKKGGRCGHDRMVVGLTTTYAISGYHH
jgi:hypothetical protein